LRAVESSGGQVTLIK
jgi:hypothetical protein